MDSKHNHLFPGSSFLDSAMVNKTYKFNANIKRICDDRIPGTSQQAGGFPSQLDG